MANSVWSCSLGCVSGGVGLLGPLSSSPPPHAASRVVPIRAKAKARADSERSSVVVGRLVWFLR